MHEMVVLSLAMVRDVTGQYFHFRSQMLNILVLIIEHSSIISVNMFVSLCLIASHPSSVAIDLHIFSSIYHPSIMPAN